MPSWNFSVLRCRLPGKIPILPVLTPGTGGVSFPLPRESWLWLELHDWADPEDLSWLWDEDDPDE